MARIRTIKPEFFKHEGLYDAELETGLPLRLAFAGLWPQCDREGRFAWRPRQLKSDILPYDEIDFSRVLDALWTRGFVVKYACGGEVYGAIPSWHRHQVINNREKASDIPAASKETIVNNEQYDACGTREERVADATGACTSGKERKGKEGEGKGKDSAPNGAAHELPLSDYPTKPAHKTKNGNGSDEDRYWAAAAELEAKGVPRSRCGQLANLIEGDFSEGVVVLREVAKAKDPTRYLGAIIRNRKAEQRPRSRGDPGVPGWVNDARAQGYSVEPEDGRWRMAGALYDDAGEQVGC